MALIINILAIKALKFTDHVGLTIYMISGS